MGSGFFACVQNDKQKAYLKVLPKNIKKQKWNAKLETTNQHNLPKIRINQVLLNFIMSDPNIDVLAYHR